MHWRRLPFEQCARAAGLVLCVLACTESTPQGEPSNFTSGGLAGAASGSGGVSRTGSGGASTMAAAAGKLTQNAGQTNFVNGGSAGSPAGSGGTANAGGSDSDASGGRSNPGGRRHGGGGKPETAFGGRAGNGAGGGDDAGGGKGGMTAANGIEIRGRQLIVNGKPFHIRGVNWNPVPKGATHPAGLDFTGLSATDVPLMQAAGINVVRTYEPLLDIAVLDRLHIANIYVLDTVYANGNDAASSVTARVNAVKSHPAILGWVVGNEWNYNRLYSSLSLEQTQQRISEVAALIKAADTSHPVITIYGELPSASILEAMPLIDIWGINAYRGISFGNLFSEYRGRSAKPMFLGEYGADAYNSDLPGYDPSSQAEAVSKLTQELLDNASATKADGTTLGGTVFEWADEWWKADRPNDHDVGGTAPGGGPFPDGTFNEEWWGLVDIDRVPRPAYEALRALYMP